MEITQEQRDAILKDALDKAQEVLMTQPESAEIILDQLLRCIPNHEKGLQFLGLAKHRQGKYEEALEVFKTAIEHYPENADCYNNIALSYASLDDIDNAQKNLQKAVELRPDCPEYYNNLALQYRMASNFDKAKELALQAVKIKDNSPPLWTNLAGINAEMRNMDEAITCLKKAIEIDPTFPDAHVDLAYTHHLKGQWEEGFKEYEWRFNYFKQLVFYKRAYDQDKKWEKESLKDKRIILYCEQGIGDAIHFIRYASQVKELGAYVIVHCFPNLKTVIERVEGVDEVFCRDIVHNQGDEMPEHDCHCSIMSLPYLLDDYEISGKSYISPIAKFDVKEHYPDTFNIGISWAGSPAHSHDRSRSILLKLFKPLHNLKGVRLFSLQKDVRPRKYFNSPDLVDFSAGCEDMKLVDMTKMIQTWDDTLTIISGLDLVVSVDTALAHLAGAAGVPCWMLVPFNPDWRWKLDGETTEWYNSLRLFRQQERSNWPNTIKRLCNEIEMLLSSK